MPPRRVALPGCAHAGRFFFGGGGYRDEGRGTGYEGRGTKDEVRRTTGGEIRGLEARASAPASAHCCQGESPCLARGQGQ